MKNIIKLFSIIFIFSTFSGCDVLEQAAKTAQTSMIPSQSEMVSGLKQALQVGTNQAVSYLNKEGGYLNNSRFKIPFPPEVANVAQKLRDLGFGSQVDEFVKRMNRGAEDAAKEAAPIFLNAINTMTITDAKNILLGNNDAATKYFESKTRAQLYNTFSPKIKNSLDKFAVTKYWSDLTKTYNSLPLVKPVETDLLKYTTNKALDGLFLKVSDEEQEIRNNLSARSTDLLRKVFGWAAAQK